MPLTKVALASLPNVFYISVCAVPMLIKVPYPFTAVFSNN